MIRVLIADKRPALKILIFLVRPEDSLSLCLLEADAAGYLSKENGVDGVLDAIRTIAAGRRYLSPRERQVFDRLLQGMSVSAIAGELEVSASTASNHLSRIRDKLGVEHNGEVLVCAARAGLL
jgi:two-component system invasion response regulator UvrY